MDRSEYQKERFQWKELLEIVHHLRQPDGCPWDRAQTYESMLKCVQDETQEVVDAVNQEDVINLREELGDLMLQVLMYSEIASEREDFTLDDVIDELAKKLIRRHPHVFADEPPAQTKEEGQKRWKEIKLIEKEQKLQEYEKWYQDGRIKKELLDRKREMFERLKKQ